MPPGHYRPGEGGSCGKGHIEQTQSMTTESSEEKTTYHVQYTTKEAHQSQANTGQGNLSVIFAKAGTFK